MYSRHDSRESTRSRGLHDYLSNTRGGLFLLLVETLRDQIRLLTSQPIILPRITSSCHLSSPSSCCSSLIGTTKRSAPTLSANFSSAGMISPGGLREYMRDAPRYTLKFGVKTSSATALIRPGLRERTHDSSLSVTSISACGRASEIRCATSIR